MKIAPTIRVTTALIAFNLGCGELAPEEVETVSSALLDGAGTGMRGYTRVDGSHALVFRTHGFPPEVVQTNPIKFLGPNPIATGATPWGYKRTDNVNAIVYVADNRHIHEVRQVGSNWIDTDFFNPPINAPLAAPAPANGPVPDVIAYVRSDNRSTLVYRGANNHIIEIASNFGSSPTWIVNDLTIFTSAPDVTLGSVFPYIRTDNNNALVYVSNNRIYEISSNFGGTPAWLNRDLYTNSTETVAPSTDPWGYKRSDNFNSVMFVGTDGKLHELWRKIGTPCPTLKAWCAGINPVAVAPSGGLYRRPSAYVRWDNKNAIVYVSNVNSLHELSLAPGGSWVDAALPIGISPPPDSFGQPFAHRAPGNINSVSGRAYLEPTGAGAVNFKLTQPLNGVWTSDHFGPF